MTTDKVPINNCSFIMKIVKGMDKEDFAELMKHTVYVKSNNSSIKGVFGDLIPPTISVLKEYREYFDEQDYKKIINKSQLLSERFKEIAKRTKQIVETKFPFLYPFQKKIAIFGTARLLTYNQLNLFLEVGTGKTLISSVISKIIKGNKLIVCPSSIKEQWKKELFKFNISYDVQIISGDKTKRLIAFKNPKEYNIISYESLRNDLPDLLTIDPQFFKKAFKCIILDEAHKIKNRQSKLYKALKDICYDIDYVILLTGTPAINTLEELFNLTTLRSFLYAQKLKVFRELYGTEYTVRIGKRNIKKYEYHDIDKFYETIKYNSFVLKKEDVKSELPKLQEIFIQYENELYTQHLFYKIFQDVYQENMLSAFQTLRLISMGTGFLDEMNVEWKNDIKIDKKTYDVVPPVLDKLEEIQDHQVLLFSSFQIVANHFYNEIRKRFPTKKVAILTGSTRPKEKEEIIVKFKNKEIDFLVATDTIKEGVSFSDVDYLINIDLPLTYAAYQQRVGRIFRINSKNNKTVISFYDSLIGSKIYEIVKGKKTYQNKLEIIRELLKKI